MGRRQIIAALFVLFGLAMLTGCGSGDDNGGSDGSATAASDPAKTEFVNKANALCTRMIAQMQLEGKKIFNEESDVDEAPVFGRRLVHEVIIPTLEEEIQGIRALNPPAADDAQVKAILAAIQNIIDRLESNRNSENDIYPYKKAEALADKYGISKCGQPSLNS